jgi:hypothetical protein
VDRQILSTEESCRRGSEFILTFRNKTFNSFESPSFVERTVLGEGIDELAELPELDPFMLLVPRVPEGIDEAAEDREELDPFKLTELDPFVALVPRVPELEVDFMGPSECVCADSGHFEESLGEALLESSPLLIGPEGL